MYTVRDKRSGMLTGIYKTREEASAYVAGRISPDAYEAIPIASLSVATPPTNATVQAEVDRLCRSMRITDLSVALGKVESFSEVKG